MDSISFNFDKTLSFISKDVLADNFSSANVALSDLLEGKGKGNDFLGWVNLPNDIDDTLLGNIEQTAKLLQENFND